MTNKPQSPTPARSRNEAGGRADPRASRRACAGVVVSHLAGLENKMHFWYSQTQRNRLKAFITGRITVIINNLEHEFTTCSDDLTACPAHLDTEYIGYAHVEDIRFPEHNNEDARL